MCSHVYRRGAVLTNKSVRQLMNNLLTYCFVHCTCNPWLSHSCTGDCGVMEKGKKDYDIIRSNYFNIQLDFCYFVLHNCKALALRNAAMFWNLIGSTSYVLVLITLLLFYIIYKLMWGFFPVVAYPPAGWTRFVFWCFSAHRGCKEWLLELPYTTCGY